MAILEGNPTNAPANVTYGKYRIVTGDWDGAMPFLALGSDKRLRRVAELEISKPTSNDKKVQLGDAWKRLAETTHGKMADLYNARADNWYRQAGRIVDNANTQERSVKRTKRWTRRRTKCRN